MRLFDEISIMEERIILRWIFRKWGYGLDRTGSG
jgi:hypothetical protein